MEKFLGELPRRTPMENGLRTLWESALGEFTWKMPLKISLGECPWRMRLANVLGEFPCAMTLEIAFGECLWRMS